VRRRRRSGSPRRPSGSGGFTLTPTERPPAHLSAPTRRWWTSTMEAYDLEPHHVRLLTLAAESFDRAVQARRVLAAEGITYTDRWGQPHPHPCVAVERDAALRFSRLLRELDLDCAPLPDPRPPRRGRR
jgi:phage terminase small subunit